MTVYQVTYKDGIFELENKTKTTMGGGETTNKFGDTSPDQHIQDVIKHSLVNDTSIEEHLIDVKEKADILNNAIQAYKKAEQVAIENKANQSQENNKIFDKKLIKIKSSINKFEGGKRKTFRKKIKKSKKNNSKNKHNNRL